MNALQHRCLRHDQREAVARCPECRQYFCRECITEHDDRVICAGCLKKIVQAKAPFRLRLPGLVLPAQAMLAVLVAWLFFNLIGVLLLNVSVEVHDGTFWESE